MEIATKKLLWSGMTKKITTDKRNACGKAMYIWSGSVQCDSVWEEIANDLNLYGVFFFVFFFFFVVQISVLDSYNNLMIQELILSKLKWTVLLKS